MASSSKKPQRSSKKSSTSRQTESPGEVEPNIDGYSTHSQFIRLFSDSEANPDASPGKSPDSGKHVTEAAVVSAGSDLGELGFTEAGGDRQPPSWEQRSGRTWRSEGDARADSAPGDVQGHAEDSEATARSEVNDAEHQKQQKQQQQPTASVAGSEPSDEAEGEPTVLNANVGDQPASDDALGFRPYVEAIASFLTNPQTGAPLTLSIEGEWGSGKSSFMLQLRERLKNSDQLTLDFNAWRHDKDDAMWAAFALEFVGKLSRQLTLPRRLLAHLKLLRLRFDWQTGWRDIARAAVYTLVLLAVCALPFAFGRERLVALLDEGSQQQQQQQPAASDTKADAKEGADEDKPEWQDAAVRRVIGVGGIAGYFGVVLFLFLKLKDLLRNPLTVNLRQHVQSPDYNARVAFIEQFHEDFARMVATYAGGRKVFVFIDDLDRCEVPKAADMMQALNLMVSGDNPLVFVIGMDREKVAAGLAVKYEKLLPYLAPAPQPASAADAKPAFDPVLGLEYGYAFIEKFIQLPFVVPQAGEAQLKKFLATITGRKEEPDDPDAPVTADDAAAATTAAHNPQGSDAERAVENVKLLGEILRAVAPAFEYNPRRLKQFINTFRLKTYIASRTGLFDDPGPGYAPLTPYKLGKFVAVTLRWPLLLADLDTDRQLLTKLQEWALRKLTPTDLKKLAAHDPFMSSRLTDAALRWSGRENLMSFLRVDCLTNNDVDMDKAVFHSLEDLNVSKLLQVSPPVKTAATKAPPADPPANKPPRIRIVGNPADNVATRSGWPGT